MRRQERGPDPRDEYVRTIDIKGERREVVTAKGLLHLAHKERLSRVRTRVRQAPTKENGETAIVSAEVVTQRGTFTAIGDANPRNVNARIAPHFIRMAETRAIARALRSALDIGHVAIEELEEEFSLSDEPPDRPRDQPRADRDRPASDGETDRPRETERRSNGHTPSNGAPPRQNGGGYDRGAPSGDVMSEPQKKMLYRIAFEQGHEGDAARAWLHTELGVDSLTKVGRRQASAFIDHYKSNGNAGRNGGHATGDNGHAGPG